MRVINWVYRVVSGMSETIGETWPMLLMGGLGGAMVVGGLIALWRGW